MSRIYTNLICTNFQVYEQKKDYQILTERHLQILWSEQKWLKGLKTSKGEKVEVISQGIWNTQGGPDFLKAHLKIGLWEYRGDIEIHLHEEGWFEHGHHLNEHYDQVVLHVSYWSSRRHALSINKSNGQQPFSLYLEEQLELSINELIPQIDLDFYPSKQYSNRGMCAEAIFDNLSNEKLHNLMQSAAYWRLEKKLIFLDKYYPDNPSYQLVAGIATALGYKKNSQAFLDLFTYLIEFRYLSHDELLSIALGTCGFLEKNRQKKWEASQYYQFLRTLWEGKKSEIIHQTTLNLDRIRPLHHPIRRLFYLTNLLQDDKSKNLWNNLLEIWKKALKAPSIKLNILKNLLLEIIPDYQNPYWKNHYTFESKNQSKDLPSLGNEIKMHILINTFLPLIYGTIKDSGNVEEWKFFQEFYFSLEIPLTAKSRYLYQRFFNPSQDLEILSKAQITQGAYQIHHDFCLHFEASCHGCPFVERYKSTSLSSLTNE